MLAFPDTQGYGSGGVDTPYTSSDYAFQNSENLVFGQFAPLSFDENADDTFLITLALSGANGFIGSVSETVVVGAGATPLPASLPLFASGVAALGFLKRRKKRVNIPAAA